MNLKKKKKSIIRGEILQNEFKPVLVFGANGVFPNVLILNENPF